MKYVEGSQLPKMSTGTREMMCRTGKPCLRRACSTKSCRSQAERSSGCVEMTIKSGLKLATASSRRAAAGKGRGAAGVQPFAAQDLRDAVEAMLGGDHRGVGSLSPWLY